MDVQIIPIVGMLIPIIIVPTALGFRHARYLRQVEHEERMKAMEMGRTLAEDLSWTPTSVAMTIGGAVPIASMFIAYIASPKVGPSDTIWRAAGMIGVAGVICGSLLAAQLFSKANQANSAPLAQKPEYDPEEFDVVGRRG
jgi:hypothetical protein